MGPSFAVRRSTPGNRAEGAERREKDKVVQDGSIGPSGFSMGATGERPSFFQRFPLSSFTLLTGTPHQPSLLLCRVGGGVISHARRCLLTANHMRETYSSSFPAASAGRTSLEGKSVRQQRFELLIGSNVFRDTNGVVKIEEKEQLVVEWRPDEGLLLVTMDLYDEQGTRTAHLRRNVLAVNRSGQFGVEVHRSTADIRTDPPWIRLFDHQYGMMVLDVLMTSEYRAHVRSGRFYSHRGTLVEITPHYCRLGSQATLFGEIVEARGGMVVLGSERSRPLSPAP